MGSSGLILGYNQTVLSKMSRVWAEAQSDAGPVKKREAEWGETEMRLEIRVGIKESSTEGCEIYTEVCKEGKRKVIWTVKKPGGRSREASKSISTPHPSEQSYL